MWIFLLPAAAAWTLQGWAWDEAAMPVELTWYGSLPGWEQQELQQTIDGALGTWNEALPCGWEAHATYTVDALDRGDEPGLSLLFGDAAGDAVFEGGELGFSEPTGPVASSMPIAMTAAIPGDARLRPDDEVADVSCSDAVSLQTLIAHVVGHSWGLGESCVEGRCSADELEATMWNWFAPCEVYRSSIGVDDRAGLAQLYPPELALDCDPDAADPLLLRCHGALREGHVPEDLVWELGDGATATGLDVEHRYAEGGPYTVHACVSGGTCTEPRCAELSVIVVDFDAEAAKEADGEDGVGCASAPGGVGWGLCLGALAALRRRARSRS